MSVRVAAIAVCTGVCVAGAVQAATLAPPSVPAASPAGTGTGGARLHPFQHAYTPATPVKLTRSLAGRKLIFNETPVQQARRFATELLPVPDLPGMPSGALEPLIRRHCDAHGLDPRLVRAVIQVESGYNQRARSNKGAMGLMQLMPDTAVELAVFHPYDADENLRGGTAYLRRMIDAFAGSVEMAVAAYNAGPGAVERHRGVPPYPDTVDYVQRVMALYRGSGSGAPAVQWQVHSGLRPAPRVTRGASGRVVITTSLSSLR